MKYLLSLLFLIAMPVGLVHAQFDGYSGYTFATNKSEVASSETGVIAKILVKEGQFVKAGQPLVQLDDETYKIQLESAKHDASNKAELETIAKRVEIQQQSLAKLKHLLESGNARPSEWERENLELEALKSSFEHKQHDLQGRALQFEKAKAMLEKRTIVAPFDGQVARIHRRRGEFVSPNTPEVITLVDASELVAEFQVPVAELKDYDVGATVPIRIGTEKRDAVVDSIGVLVDRASQTVTLKVRINNSDYSIRTGTDCVLITPY